ncbi:MAG: right-handed parallel beta-helix repeat-containing protein [Rhodospirillaceae bacterium]
MGIERNAAWTFACRFVGAVLLALVAICPTVSRANPFAAHYLFLPGVSADSVTLSLSDGTSVDGTGQAVVTNAAVLTFSNLRSADGYVAANFAMTFGRRVGTNTIYVQMDPASEPVLRGIAGMVNVSISNLDLDRPFTDTAAYSAYDQLPSRLRRTVLAALVKLPTFIVSANTVSRGDPRHGPTLWTQAEAAALADRFVKIVFGSSLRAGPIYSGAQTDGQSILRFHNTGVAAGTVSVTLSDLATGNRLGTWTSPVINARVAAEYPIQDIESALGIVSKPAHYAVAMQTGITGAYQHVLRKGGDGTLTNLTACDSGVMTDAGHLNNVHSSRLNADRPSTIVLTNTGTIAATATFGVYDARNGNKLGVYTSASIAPDRALQLSMAEIETAIGRTPTEGMDHYVIKMAGAFPGTLQHLVTNVASGITSDMTQVCSLGVTYPMNALPAAHAGVVSSSKQSAASFLRFYNGGETPGTVAVELENAATGAAIGTWTSPVIPPRAVANHYISDIEIGAGAPAVKPDGYKLRVMPSIAGHFQHVLWRPANGSIANLSTCDGGAVAGATVLTSVHTTNVAGAYPSTVAVMNTGDGAASVALGIYSERTGTKLGTYTTASIPGGGGRLVPVSDIEAAAGIIPGDMIHYVVRIESGFVGYLQHLMGNTQPGVVTDMTARCLMDPSQAETRAVRYVAPDGNDLGAGTLAQPFRTIQKCASSVTRGGTCYVRAGRYYETVTPNAGITIAAYNGENATIDGTDAVTGWAAGQGSAYVASVQLAGVDHNQVFVGQQMMTEARWPNGDDLLHPNWAQADPGTNDTTLADLQLPTVDFTGAFLNFWSGWNPWSFQTARVVATVFPRLTHTLDIASYAPSIAPMENGRYYFFGARILLDSQREWFYDHGEKQLWFWAPGGVDPNTLNVRVKKRDLAIDLRGKTGVVIKGINLFAATIRMDEASGGNVVDGITAEYVSHFTRAYDKPASPGSGRSANIGTTGIILDGSRNSIVNSTIRYSGGNGIALYGVGNLARNNLIHGVAYRGMDNAGIVVKNSDHTIHRNTIHDSGADGIAFDAQTSYAPTNIDIGYNNIHRVMLVSANGGGVTVANLLDAGLSSRIHHNWIHDIQSPYDYFGGLAGSNFTLRGVYFDAGATGWETDQNIIWNIMSASLNVRGDPTGVNERASTHSIHHNSIIDVDADSEILVSAINPSLCGTLRVSDNYALVAVRQQGAFCTLGTNGSTSAGASEMTGVTPGCSFAGCDSAAPPPVTDGVVAASVAYTPHNVTVRAGEVATFKVIGAGSGSLSYLWRRNGALILGASSSTYSFTPTAADNGARYSVLVTNALRTIASGDAILTVE